MSEYAQPAQTVKSKLYSDPSTRPTMLPPVWDAIPASLRALPQWIAWELRWVEKRACWAKVPIDVRGVSATDGYSRAKSDTPRTWTTFDRVSDAWGRTYGTFTPRDPDGPGFVFNGAGLVGIDGDKCRDPQTGEISEFGCALMARFPGYWEVSPSGTGIKGVFFGVIPDGKGRKLDYPEGHGVELYDRGRYFAITGRRIEGATADLTSIAEPLPAFVAELDAIKAARKPAKTARVKSTASYSTDYSAAAPIDVSEKTRRARSYLATVEGAVEYQGGDNATFRAACVLVLGFDLTPEQAMPLLCEWNRTCQPPWDESWLWRKVSEADRQPGERGHLLHDRRPKGPIGYDGMTPEEVTELINGLGRSLAVDLVSKQPDTPVAEPEDCAIYASQDVSDEINLSGLRCVHLAPIMMEKDGRAFVCERWCGNGSGCCPCLMRRLYARTREGNAYLVRTSVTASGAKLEDAPRVVMAAIVPAAIRPNTTRWNTLTNAVRDRGGERASLLTDDATGTAERLGRTPDASRFLLSENKVEGESGTARLWLISMPAGTPDTLTLAGVHFHRVPVANAIRGWFHAVKTVPDSPGAHSRFKPHHKSAGWGDEEPQTPTTVKVLRPSKFGVHRTRKILDLVGIEAYSVQFDRRNGSDPGVGWGLTGARSLAMEVWLGGVDAPEAPTVSRVAELARYWLRLIPADIGSGHRVMRVLAEHVWTCALYDITPLLRAADEQDRAEEASLAEASELYASLRDQVARGELVPTGLLAELLA